MRCFLLVLALVLAAVAPGPRPASAQNDWGAKRDPFDKRLVARYKRLLANNPSDHDARRRLVRLYRRYRSLATLITEYERAYASTPSFATALVLGYLQLDNGDQTAALVLFEQAAAISPNDYGVHTALGELHQRAGNLAQARTAYERALPQANTRKRKQTTLRTLADLALNSEDISAARDYFDQYIALDPKNTDAQVELADALAKHGLHREAIQVLADTELRLRADPQRRVEVIARIGAAHEALGQEDAAIREYRRAMAMVRRDYYLRRELTERVIEIHRRRQDLASLITYYEQQWPQRKRDHFEWDILARLYVEAGNQEQAIEAYRKAVRKAPHELDTQRRLIVLLENSGREQEALAQYEVVVRVAPGEPRFQLELAERYWERANPKAALALLAKIARRFPHDAGVHAALANLYAKWGKQDAALRAYVRLTEIEPGEIDHLVNLGEQHWLRNDKDKALAIWRRIAARKTPASYARLAEVYAEHGHNKEAIAMYDKAIKLEPANPGRYRGRARAHARNGNHVRAAADWESVLTLTSDKPTDRPHRKEARRQIVIELRSARLLTRRSQQWLQLFEADPPDIGAGYFLVEVYLKGKRPKQARTVLEKIATLRPADKETLELLVTVYRRLGLNDLAIQRLVQLAELSPGMERQYYVQIAEIKAEQYADDEAIAWSEKALDKSPNDPSAHEELAHTYERMQQEDKAIASYERVLQLDPRNFRIHFRLAHLYVRHNRRAEAADLYRAVLRRASDEQTLHRAGRRAIDLEEYMGTLGELERVVAPLAFTFSHKVIYRSILVELYDRYVQDLVAELGHHDPAVRMAARTELDRLGKHGLKPLLEALADDQTPAQQRIAVNVLGHLGNAGAAMPLVKLAANATTTTGPPRARVGALSPNISLDLRVEALVSAGRLGDPRTMPILLGLLRHRDVALREAAVYALGMTGDRRAVPALLSALDDAPSVRTLACFGLARTGGHSGSTSKVRAAAIRTMAQPGPQEPRAACAFVLGYLGDRAAVPALIEALADGNGETQRLAAWALGRIGDPRAMSALLAAYLGKGDRVRTAAAWALPRVVAGARTAATGAQTQLPLSTYPMRLARYDATTAVREVVGPLQAPPLSPRLVVGHEQELLEGLVAALGRHRDLVVRVLLDLDARPDGIGLGLLTAELDQAPAADQAAVRAAIARIATELYPTLDELARSDSDLQVRSLALSVVSKLPAPQAWKTLQAGLKAEDPDIRQAAMGAAARYASLGGAHSADLSPLVVESLDADPWRERAAAATALVGFGPRAPTDALVATLADRNGFVRQSAATALGQLHRRDAVPALLALTEDESRTVAVAAIMALVEIGDPRAEQPLRALADDPNASAQVRAAAARFTRKK